MRHPPPTAAMIRKRLVPPAAALALALGAMAAPAKLAQAAPGSPTAPGSPAVPGGPAWACDTSGYLFKFSPTGPTTIYRVRLPDGHVSTYGTAEDAVNAVGYNTRDNYMYGWDQSTGHLAGIASNGTLTQLGVPAGMSRADASSGFNVGDFDHSGDLYLMASATGVWDEVDLSPGSPHYDTVIASGIVAKPAGVTALPSDWAYTNGAFYGMAANDGDADLISFHPVTRKLTNLGPVSDVPGSATYGAAFAAPDGNLWVSDNVTGQIYQVNVLVVTGSRFSLGSGGIAADIDNNDGARCGLAPAPAPPPHGAVTFIGDSVTAGYDYCGIAENAKNISCTVNEAVPNSWYVGDNSLSDCNPPAPPAPPTNACSNDNDNGKPWDAGPWTPGPRAPMIAYPYQIAASQSRTGNAQVSDWAVTGATPARWDPDGGIYGPQLKKIKDQYVVVMLGANPLLATYLNIAFHIVFKSDVQGPCVDSTGYQVGKTRFATWYSGPISRTIACAQREWTDLHQTEHLVNIYKALLSLNDRVLVLGYYLGCPWTFGNWQPSVNLFDGPAEGNSCSSQRRQVSPTDHAIVTQWDQAKALDNSLNHSIHDAVVQARDWAKNEWPGTNRYQDLAWTTPDQDAWAAHQPGSPNGSWIFLNDTWIHPNQDGHQQLAHSVTAAMCAHFGHWCGTPPVWG
jgi:hypothetical protein